LEKEGGKREALPEKAKMDFGGFPKGEGTPRGNVEKEQGGFKRKVRGAQKETVGSQGGWFQALAEKKKKTLAKTAREILLAG